MYPDLARKNFYSSVGEKPEWFQDMCNDFNFRELGTTKYYNQLGKGAAGTAYSFEHKFKRESEAYFGKKDIVVKHMTVSDVEPCKVDYLVIGTKGKKPQKLTGDIFYCEENSALSEFFLSMICSNFNSVNFIDTYAYNSCEKLEREIQQFVFMEKIDGTLSKLLEILETTSTDKEDHDRKYDILIIQMLHAFWCMHSAGINHNDGHSQNIFYVEINSDTQFRDSNGILRYLRDYEYVQYSFGDNNDVTYYIPVKDMKYIIKVGDFGLSQKYSKPYILNSKIQQDWALDYFCPMYDLMILFQSVGSSTSDLTKMIQVFIMEIPGVDFINKNSNAGAFMNWVEKKKDYDEDCPNVDYIRNVVFNKDYSRLEKILNNVNNYARFIPCRGFYYVPEGDRNKRQNYNFDLREMKNKEHINIDNLIRKPFFKTRMAQLGFDRIPLSGNVCLFGGPGNKNIGERVVERESTEGGTNEGYHSDSDGFSSLSSDTIFDMEM
jgi:serine/threonine protein kinase